MIYRNSALAGEITWTGDANAESGEIIRTFLSGERDLLKIGRVRTSAIVDLQIFLESAAGRPICVERAATGELLIYAVGSRESLLLTGRTADVAGSHLDDEAVSMDDYSEMTIRRVAS